MAWEQQGQKSNFQKQKLKIQLANLKASAKNRKVYSLQLRVEYILMTARGIPTAKKLAILCYSSLPF